MCAKYTYRIGSLAERTIMKYFEDKGWICFRMAGSGKHNKVDVICVNRGKVVLLDVKLRRAVNHVEYPVEQLLFYRKIYDDHKVDVYLCIKLKDTRTYRLLHIKDVIDEPLREDQNYVLVTLTKLQNKGISIVDFLNQY